jgi:hypothetical protein
VNHLDVARRTLERGSEPRINLRERTSSNAAWYLEGRERHFVVPARHLAQCTVAIHTHAAHYLLSRLAHEPVRHARSAQDGSALVRG